MSEPASHRAPNRRANLIIFGMVLAVALPAALSYGYYSFTGDPTMRPLGITLASLSESGVPGFTGDIVVLIEWGRSARPLSTREEVKAALQAAMSVYPADTRIKLRETAGDRVRVFFLVGENRMGPYSLANVAAGIRPAIEAYGMIEKAKPASAPQG